MIDLKCVRRGCMKFAILKQNLKSWWKSQDNPKTRIFEERAIVTSVKRKLAKLLFETCEGLFLILNLFRRFIYIYVCVRVCVRKLFPDFDPHFIFIPEIKIEILIFPFLLQIAREWRLFRRARLRRAKSVAIENATLRYHGWRRKKNRVKRIRST